MKMAFKQRDVKVKKIGTQIVSSTGLSVSLNKHTKKVNYKCLSDESGASQVVLAVKSLPANAGDMRYGFNP